MLHVYILPLNKHNWFWIKLPSIIIENWDNCTVFIYHRLR